MVQNQFTQSTWAGPYEYRKELNPKLTVVYGRKQESSHVAPWRRDEGKATKERGTQDSRTMRFSNVLVQVWVHPQTTWDYFPGLEQHPHRK